MLHFALNHMTVPSRPVADVVDLAASLGCAGVELRNDLGRPLFDGQSPGDVGNKISRRGVRLFALAEVKSFNDWSDDTAAAAENLMAAAKDSGAEAIALIPRCDGQGRGNGERQANLRVAIRELAPMLERYGMIGLIEPLGFEISSLRYKAEAMDAISALGHLDRFRLVHDTFHHHLAGETDFFTDQTGMVHISGVDDPDISVTEMTDAHRVHVGPRDRLGNVDQIETLCAAGYTGPLSVEAFSPDVHTSLDPGGDLARSFAFIRDALSVPAA